MYDFFRFFGVRFGFMEVEKGMLVGIGERGVRFFTLSFCFFSRRWLVGVLVSWSFRFW